MIVRSDEESCARAEPAAAIGSEAPGNHMQRFSPTTIDSRASRSIRPAAEADAMPDMHGAVPQLHDYLEHSARRLPDKVALVADHKRLTYRELDRRANALAHDAGRARRQRGDRVIVFGDNTVDTVVAFWAVLKANAVVSIVNPLTKADKLEYYLKDCRASALITDAHLESGLAGAGGEIDRGSRRRSSAPADPRLSAERDDAAAAREHRHRPRRDHLHLGIDRRPQGRDAHAPQHAHGGDVDHAPTSRTSRTTSSSASCRWRSTTASTR